MVIMKLCNCNYNLKNENIRYISNPTNTIMRMAIIEVGIIAIHMMKISMMIMKKKKRSMMCCEVILNILLISTIIIRVIDETVVV